jgi:metal-dependent amidase/aminoacylase/carboxypeptidase family protein
MEEFVELRRIIHQYPETSTQEFKTTQRIRDIAIKHGVREEWIRMMPSTGLWIDLTGQAEPSGKNVRIAFRADIDALEMNENN